VDAYNIHVSAALYLDSAIRNHLCDGEGSPRVSRGRNFSLLLPVVRLEHEENLVSDLLGVLESLFVFFCIIFACKSNTECFDALLVDQHLLQKIM
jgi:hypothetical protein